MNMELFVFDPDSSNPREGGRVAGGTESWMPLDHSHAINQSHEKTTMQEMDGGKV